MNTSTLTISLVQQEDEDEYYCVASNNVEDQSDTAVVAVLSENTGTSDIYLSYSTYTMYISIVGESVMMRIVVAIR